MADWIEWGGGECPVPGNVRCEHKFRDGAIEIDRADTYVWPWDKYMPEYDIIAYRVVSAAGATQ